MTSIGLERDKCWSEGGGLRALQIVMIPPAEELQRV